MSSNNEMQVYSPPTLAEITPDQFRASVGAAKAKAEILKGIVESQQLYAMISGRKYLEVEAWQTIAQAYGYSARVVWSRKLEGGGWEAHAEVIDPIGMVVSAAEAEAGTEGDNPWDKRPSYQQRSMAQTRAISKSLRSKLSWVVVLAGYAATPADEMPRESHQQAQKPRQQASRGNTGQGISEAQVGRLIAIMKANDVPEGAVRIWMGHMVPDKTSRRQLTKLEYDDVVDWVERGGHVEEFLSAASQDSDDEEDLANMPDVEQES